MSASTAPLIEPSQVRRLAKDYAQGRLELEAYRRQRQVLIDGIVAGAIAIEREAPGVDGDAVARATKPPARARAARSPTSMLIGLAVIALVGWALWSALRPKPPPDTSASPPVIVPERQVSVARGMVETFLAARPWDRARISQFERQWSTLGPDEQAQARAAPWFGKLVAALETELKDELALESARAERRGSDRIDLLIAMATTLGVADSLSIESRSATEPTSPRPPLSQSPPDAEPVSVRDLGSRGETGSR